MAIFYRGRIGLSYEREHFNPKFFHDSSSIPHFYHNNLSIVHPVKCKKHSRITQCTLLPAREERKKSNKVQFLPGFPIFYLKKPDHQQRPFPPRSRLGNPISLDILVRPPEIGKKLVKGATPLIKKNMKSMNNS